MKFRARPLTRLLALLALVGAIVAGTALPASAHATQLSTEPTAGGTYAASPSAITLRFSESVEVSRGGVKVFGAKDRKQVVTGKPEHPNGDGSFVTVDLPDLGDGTYVVTWRVISADGHPVNGAFTFSIGEPSKLPGSAQALATNMATRSTVVRGMTIRSGTPAHVAMRRSSRNGSSFDDRVRCSGAPIRCPGATPERPPGYR